ncbi:MAG TPA: hypothetical protein VFO16_02680 [Pseudonocardiaceae bacterium]|nr:hypothetical protein [Pseudonocardiaceae bacterium]
MTRPIGTISRPTGAPELAATTGLPPDGGRVAADLGVPPSLGAGRDSIPPVEGSLSGPRGAGAAAPPGFVGELAGGEGARAVPRPNPPERAPKTITLTQLTSVIEPAHAIAWGRSISRSAVIRDPVN